MAKSDARFGYQADFGRTDHDLSQAFGFTTAPGMLLPIWYDFASPGDSYYMNHVLPLLRSGQLAAPAMVDVKVHYETFFVPLQLIYQPAENALMAIKEQYSSQFDITNFTSQNFPTLNLANLVTNIRTNYTNSDYRADAFRLADLFGLCPDAFADTDYSGSSSVGPVWYTPSFFPWQLSAYHVIFYRYYRLDDKSSFDNWYNLDAFYSGLVTTTPAEWCAVHQRPWDFDYFTSMYRSPIVSSTNAMTLLPNAVYSSLFNSATRPLDDSGNGTTTNTSIRSYSTGTGTTYSQTNDQRSISVTMIRQAFANEKLAMISGRTRKNYDSQVLAHYGVKVPHDVKHDITLIHHDEYDLNVQEVTNLAQSSQAALGELAGKSYASGKGEKFKFTAPCHGVVMTIFSVEPKVRYHSNFDRLNAVTSAFDLPVPEYDRLGNVPMFRYEAGFINQGSSETRLNSDIIGWKERYYQFKRKFDKVSYAFALNLNSSTSYNNYAPYFLSMSPFGTPHPVTDMRPDLESRFYIPRDAMDNVCLVQFSYGWKTDASGENWNKTPWLAYARDPFIVNSYITCKKVSWMSKDGEPIYNF